MKHICILVNVITYNLAVKILRTNLWEGVTRNTTDLDWNLRRYIYRPMNDKNTTSVASVGRMATEDYTDR